MPEVHITLKNGSTVPLTLPDPGEGPSAFLLSLPKAGSTLFYRLMAPIAIRAGLPYFSLPNALHDRGVAVREVAGGLADVLRPTGYMFGGYRGVEPGLELPDYADGRTVVLIRDPRDMLTSLYFSEAKSHEPPGTSASETLLKQFEERRAHALATPIDEFVLARALGVRQAFQTLLATIEGKRHLLFRYEDVIFDKQRWMDQTIAYLGFDVPPGLVRNVISKQDIVPAEEDPTSHIRKVAPGDHREKLKPETIEQLDAAFAELLERFGYPYVKPAEPVPIPLPGETPEQLAERLRAERRAARVAERVAERRAAAAATRQA